MSAANFLKIIDEEADRLRELIDSLLDSSRLQAGTMHMQFQNIRLDTFLRDIAMRARTRHESVNLALELNAQGIISTGRCNPPGTGLRQFIGQCCKICSRCSDYSISRYRWRPGSCYGQRYRSWNFSRTYRTAFSTLLPGAREFGFRTGHRPGIIYLSSARECT